MSYDMMSTIIIILPWFHLGLCIGLAARKYGPSNSYTFKRGSSAKGSSPSGLLTCMQVLHMYNNNMDALSTWHLKTAHSF